MDIDTVVIRRLRDKLLSREPRIEVGKRGRRADIDLAMQRRIEPFVETMFLVMMADDDPASVEHETLLAAVDVLTDGGLFDHQIEAMLDRFRATVTRDGSEARLAQIGALISADRDDRETAFTLAAVIALADDRVDVRENRTLEWVKEYFGLSDRRVALLIDSID